MAVTTYCDTSFLSYSSMDPNKIILKKGSMKAIEWALALLLGSVSLLFISLNVVVMVWGYKISQSIITKKYSCESPWVQQVVYDEEAECGLEEYVKNNSTPVKP